MDTRPHRYSRRRDPRAGRRAAAGLAVAVGLASLTSCGGDPAGTGDDPALTDEWAALQQDRDALEERIGALEGQSEETGATGQPDRTEEPEPTEEPGQDGRSTGNGDAGAGGTSVFENPEALIGEAVDVRGEVAEVFAAVEVGAAFRITGGGGGAIVVITVLPPAESLDPRDVVRVSGRVTPVQEETFEADFGIAASTLAGDPAALLDQISGTPAISATRVEIVASPAD